MIINELKSLLSRFHIKPSKKLGQNFLLSEQVLDQIVTAAALSRNDRVLEIGPGLGFLTRRLAEQAGQVIAIEKDRKLCQALRKIFKSKNNVKIICEDVLFFDPTNSYIRSDSYFVGNYKVVANIPYYLTGKILEKFLTASAKPSLMVLLLQKEVAERIVAKPGGMSILSISVQFYADPEIISVVGKENFYPVPEVDSAIVRLKVLAKPRFALSPSPLAGEGRERGRDEKRFFQLVKIGFANKRKQLHNNLTAGLGAAVIPDLIRDPGLDSRFRGNDKIKMDYQKLLQSLGLNPKARAQDLSLSDWQKLYEALVL